MSKGAEAYHHKWVDNEKDLRDRYEVMQDYAEKYHKEQLRKHAVVKQSEQYFCAKEEIMQRCKEQCLGCFQFENKD